MAIEKLITDHLDLWIAAVRPKSSAGRGSNSKLELTGIKKLRELILELAVRGKLVPQDPSDEPALVLLERIAVEKARLVKEGQLKKAKLLSEINDEEKMFELPEGWAWTRLGNVQSFINGFAFKSQDLVDEPGIGVVKIGDVYRDRGIACEKMQYILQSKCCEIDEKFKIFPGDLVITMTGDVKLGFNNTEHVFYLNQRVGKIIPHIVSPDYIYRYLLTVADRKIEEASGGVIPNVSTEEINDSVLPIPPLFEQHRIIAKVDKLMALCDQLEQQCEAQLTAHQTLVEALLTTLTDSTDADELAQNWARLAQHFDTLFTTEASIDALKQTILQLAVMGKLVPQDPSDEPAAVLLERIAAEKARLVKEKKIKKEKPLPAISEDEKPFELPTGWEWVRIGYAGVCSTGKTPSTGNSKFFDGNIPFIGPGQISPNGKLLEAEKFISESGLQNSTEALDGDILMVCIGGSIGKAVIADKQVGFNQQINAIRPIKIDSRFLLAAMTTNVFNNILLERATGSATPIINRGKWEELPIPIAPIQEQCRIITKVEELMTLCDHLKARLQTSQQTQLALAESLVEGALA